MTMEGSSPLRALEFYSGIGGMRYALEEVGRPAIVVEAFDINDLANDVYEYNFGHRPNQGNIQHLTPHQLCKYKADIWLLSPPCQPYTRQGLQKDVEDSRASSFLKLLEMLPLISKPPTHLFLENVVGFEDSVTHDRLVQALKDTGFAWQEFILTPLQFGIPYSRPRYFCLAKRNTMSFVYPQLNNRILCKPGPVAQTNTEVRLEMELLSSNAAAGDSHEASQLREPDLEPNTPCKCIHEYLDLEYVPAKEGTHVDNTNFQLKDERKATTAMENKEEQFNIPILAQYMVPDSLIDRWGDAFDIVTPTSKRCCCFTKSYGRFVKGTGSFLATRECSAKYGMTKSKSWLKQLKLRYFTPREIANLHSFPPNFNFPDNVGLKQRYALLGNSLSVAVAAALLRYLITEKNDDGLDKASYDTDSPS